MNLFRYNKGYIDCERENSKVCVCVCVCVCVFFLYRDDTITSRYPKRKFQNSVCRLTVDKFFPRSP